MPFGPKDLKKIEGVNLGDLFEIPGKPGYYITKTGRVFSVYEMSTRPDRNGYLRISTGKIRDSIHRLLAITFLARTTKDTEVRHLDGNVNNNSLENLAWGTRQDNANDMANHGTVKGVKNPRAVLSENQVREIKANKSESDEKVAAKYGVAKGTIHAIRSRRTWKHLV
jgi:hypothetical protein